MKDLDDQLPDSLNTLTREVFTVSELNQTARDVLEDCFQSVWVEGEISNLARPSSGHIYFSLKDKDASVRCAMFKGRNRTLNFTPEDGMHVVVQASVSLYVARGDYQLIVENIEEAGDGALQREFEKLKQKLLKEGLFDEAHKKALPKIPRQIGVVTSPTGAAIRDILSILKRRFPFVPVIIYPTAVQGDKAAPEIVKAIGRANMHSVCDVLIVSRGGGSLEDLWPFNEEIVARAIYASEIPIVSGVGHEIDFTICDFVADKRAPTPSAAAELLVPNCMDLQIQLSALKNRLASVWKHSVHLHRQHINHLRKRLRHPGDILREQMQRIDHCEQNIKMRMQHLLMQKRGKLTTLARALDAVSPLATLERGYAIATEATTQKIIVDASTQKPGDKLKIRVKRGAIISTVDSIEI